MRQFCTLFLLLVLMVSAANGAYSVGDYTWLSYGGHDYAATKAIGDWSTVLAEATSLTGVVGGDGHLVTINSAGENSFLVSNFSYLAGSGEPVPPASQGVWTGMYLSGAWLWESGEAVTYFRNDYTDFGLPVPGTHMYLHGTPHTEPGTWNYNAQHETERSMWLYGVIEIPSQAIIPAPSAIVLGGIGVMLVGWIRRRSAL